MVRGQGREGEAAGALLVLEREHDQKRWGHKGQ